MGFPPSLSVGAKVWAFAPFFCLIFFWNLAFVVVTPIDEAVWSVEVLLGPYTGEEHAKRLMVVRKPQLNLAYKDGVDLLERWDPDEWKKKHAHA